MPPHGVLHHGSRLTMKMYPTKTVAAPFAFAGSQCAGGSQAVNQLIVKRLTKRLDLDPSQSEKLISIVVETRGELGAVRSQIAPQVKDILADTETKVRAILKPEQQKEFDEVVEQNKERLARFEGRGT